MNSIQKFLYVALSLISVLWILSPRMQHQEAVLQLSASASDWSAISPVEVPATLAALTFI